MNKSQSLSRASSTITKTELVEEDDRLIYEIELKDDQKEIEMDIDAVNGNVLKVGNDHDDN